MLEEGETYTIAKTARESLVRMLSGDNLLVQEAHARKCAALTKELAGPQPSPLEQLLVERIVICWLQLYYAETLYVQNIQAFNLRQAEFTSSGLVRRRRATWRPSGPWRKYGVLGCQRCRSTSGTSR